MALLFIAYFGLSTFPSRNELTGELFLPSGDISYWFRWSNWDGGHFRGIAENGYLPKQTVFFPLYPLLIKILNLTGFDATWAGLLISHVSLIFALFFLYKLTALDFTEAVARRTVFALLVFPTSFYLGTLYSESLFLASTLAAFYYLRTNRAQLGGMFAAASVATRLAGVATFVGLLGEHLLKQGENFSISLLWKTKLRRWLLYLMALSIILKLITKFTLFFMPLLILLFFILVAIEFFIKNIRFKKLLTWKTLIIVLSLLPIPLYMLYQQVLFQNPFGFLTNESGWNRHFSLPWGPVLGYLNYLQSVGIFRIGNSAGVLTELIFFTGGLVGLIFSLYKLRPAYSIYYALSLILPTFSGTLIAMPRYMLVIFPIFILLGMVENEFLQKIGALFFILLLAAYSMLFMGWFWVS